MIPNIMIHNIPEKTPQMASAQPATVATIIRLRSIRHLLDLAGRDWPGGILAGWALLALTHDDGANQERLRFPVSQAGALPAS